MQINILFQSVKYCYAMKQSNISFHMFFDILGTFRPHFCIFFYFLSIVRCLPNCKHFTSRSSTSTRAYPIILSYHGISLWSSMPWPKIPKSKWLMCPQGHPHQPGPILFPILSWHFPMVLNTMAKNIWIANTRTCSIVYNCTVSCCTHSCHTENILFCS